MIVTVMNLQDTVLVSQEVAIAVVHPLNEREGFYSRYSWCQKEMAAPDQSLTNLLQSVRSGD